MADIYNLTNITNADNIFQLTQEVNQLSGELLGFMILLSFFVILFISFRGYEVGIRFTTASFLTTILSFLFRVIDLTGDRVVMSFVIITAISYILTFYYLE